MTTKRDLALAYSPGVAAPVKEIAKNPDAAYDYTTKGNLVAVISNGSAILGMGNLGALGKQGLTNSSELSEYVINIYKTMMFRGIRGTFIYACDKNLREYFKKHIEINKRY